MFAIAPERIRRDDVVVMQLATVDDQPHIQQLWPAFEQLVGEPPRLYEQIGPGMTRLAQAAEVDESRPLVEYYRRHTEIELWVPV
ncbi:MAG TPA: hypothetical protein VGL21_14455 [Jatrophihabitantaceae bacterium]